MWVFVLVLCIPFIEIALFITVGGWLTLWPTLALVAASSLAGMMLIRRQGLEMRSAFRMGPGLVQDPLSPIAHNVLIFFAALLLIIPGFFTDLIALVLLIPWVRTEIMRKLAGRLGKSVKVQGFRQRQAPPQADWVDAEFEEIGPDQQTRRPPSGWTRH